MLFRQQHKLEKSGLNEYMMFVGYGMALRELFMEKNKILRFQSHDEEVREPSKTEFALPQRAFFTLKEACDYKNLNYKTACNRTGLQPNSGKEDGKVGGRKVWRYA